MRDGEVGLILFGYGAEESKEASAGIGFPQLLDPVDSKWPSFLELRKRLAAVAMTESGLTLLVVSILHANVVQGTSIRGPRFLPRALISTPDSVCEGRKNQKQRKQNDVPPEV